MMFKSITAHLSSSRVPGLLVVLGSMLFFCAISAHAGDVTLAWNANTGEPNLSGYWICYGETSGKYTSKVDVSNRTSYTISNLQDRKTYYFAIMAYGYGDNGQAIQSDFSNEISQTIGSSSNCPCSIWAPEKVPGGGPDPERGSLELGVKFKSNVDGYVTGIRFYKASTNTGTHTGTLWDSNGNRLATATFTNETASGWQQVNFATRVPIVANTVYVASYHTNTGHYFCTEKVFDQKSVDNPPLSGVNGVYANGSDFPTQIWHFSNYWVDVVFNAQ